jgi:biopolymer transport protein ExbD
MARPRISIQEDITPNLIPMIDIMFLLLLFLMIASDMGQRELESVRLPVADSVIPDKTEEERLTINVYHGPDTCNLYEAGVTCREDRHWRIGIKGTDYADMDKLLAVLKKEGSERKVMIRADGAGPYELPQKVMHLCTQAGMYRIEVGAAQAVK